jgi:hypothetical protein
MDKTRALRGLEAVFKEVEPRKPTFSPRVLDADEEEEEAAAKEEGAKDVAAMTDNLQVCDK